MAFLGQPVFLCFLFLSLPVARLDHGIYISVLEIDPQEMKVKVFINDLQDAIRNDATSISPSSNISFPTQNRAAIEAYFQKKVQLEINSQNVPFSLTESKLEGDSYWFTFLLNEHAKWDSFHLTATYLMELFPDQSNVVKVLGKKPQFFRLTMDNTSCSFKQ